MMNFNEMRLPPVLTKVLDRLDFKNATPIQAQTIPLALEGNDIIGSAQTGTGKTLAFILPTINKLLSTPEGAALILAPTRELAQQVINVARQLLDNIPSIKTALLIGGEPISKQFNQLKHKPRIIVGTPGRVIDHLERKTLRYDNITFLVLDETDRMFDMGFSIQIEKIINKLPKNRQTLMFSATFSAKIEQLAAKYLNQPKRVAVGSNITPVLSLKQESMKVVEAEKYTKLLLQLDQRQGSIIVFVKTKINADRLASKLCKEKHVASAIHGDLRQHKRERVIKEFRYGRCRIMVATDVAARGLDVPHVQHVINYDLPQDPEDYLHRVGRTARAGADGCALSFISPQDDRKWYAIQRFMNPNQPDNNKTPSSKSRKFFGKKRRNTFSGKKVNKPENSNNAHFKVKKRISH
jgi:superfamily II DNA/RNA helicase